ncbi:MAG: hypothetical protein INF12_14520 [Methylobacterium sp.]|nr:hypothetical protein [Methylobacterium sp.]
MGQKPKNSPNLDWMMPDGFARVPIVPTPAMRDAFLRLDEKGATPSDEDDTEFRINWARAIWAWYGSAK